MPPGQDAPLLANVRREQGQGSVLKKAPKVPKEAQPTKHVRFVQGQDAPLSSDDQARESGQSKEVSGTAGIGPGAPKAPKEDQQTKMDIIVLEGSSPLKVQKSGKAKKLSGTASSEPPKTPLSE
ncbi:hypothetical protein GOP47_0027358 [Adiantum capillus-veneris]|nr:hypothetical protein GOP47_0027358 [Adiantum capillus-veneris]